ncbi:hypothetical protein [Thiorhodovibrio frisius]|uniref:hypothetical protein n=1 Tax=Thiorhodovibrio frisius TaxID=631362 RepID=UPI00118010D8|nr:hypothetical protein [Thiorhodovibrio frisius]
MPKVVPRGATDDALTGEAQITAPESFALASERDFLLLYPASGDALELRWRFRALNAKDAAAAFGSETRRAVSPSVRLRRWNELGADEPSTSLLPVASVRHGRLGLVGLEPDAWYQAELGLASPDGGWLMLARSNRLALPSVVGVDLPALWSAANAPLPTGLQALAELIMPVAETMGEPNRQSDIKTGSEAGLQAPLDADLAGFGPSFDVAFPVWETSSPPSMVVPPWNDLQAAPAIIPAAARAAGAAPDAARSQWPVAGSGPLVSPREPARMTLCGALRISGQAPPGTVLDLGGHGYRVGPGGRFGFDLDITDPELIHALLRLLPSLPVESLPVAPADAD